MKKIATTLLSLLTFPLYSAVSPSSLKIKVYQIAFSESTDCTNPIVLFSSTTGSEQNFLANPTLGSGNIPPGTYHCMMVTMDDVIKFTPSANDGGSCLGGTEYSIDLCRTTASSGGDAVTSTTDLLIGTTVTRTECAGTSQIVGSGGTANKVTLYLRTNALTNTHPNFQYVGSWRNGTTPQNSVQSGAGPSTESNNGVNLSAPFQVSELSSGTFYVDATNQVTGSGANCEMNAPEFGFRD